MRSFGCTFVVSLLLAGCSQPGGNTGPAPLASGAPSGTSSAAPAAPSAAPSEATWTHPSMALSFTYPDKLLRVSPKPDGATLQSDILGTIEDRSGQGKDRPSPLSITLSIRTGQLLDVMKSSAIVQVPTLFPAGTEASFKEEKDFATRLTVAGATGYRVQMGSHDTRQDVVYAPLPPGSTLEIVCSYVGDMAKPKVSMADQRKACDRVLSSVSIKL